MATSAVARSIKGMVTLVTGGASGLGKATVEHFHKAGAKVVVLDLEGSAGPDVVSSLKDNAIFTPADVSSEENVSAAMQKIKSEFGRLDVIVNCAGIAYAQRLLNGHKLTVMELDKYRKTFEVNVVGTVNVIRHGSLLMLEHKLEPPERGVIINTSSIAAFDGQIGQTAYAASKGAIASLTLPLARELADQSIRVNCVAPGLFHTPLVASLPKKVTEFLGKLPAYPNRLGDTPEFAMLVEHMILNTYLNGEVIRLDAGLRMPA